MATKKTSVLLTADQRARLEALRTRLERERPDLVATSRGGRLTTYAVLRLVIARGLSAAEGMAHD